MMISFRLPTLSSMGISRNRVDLTISKSSILILKSLIFYLAKSETEIESVLVLVGTDIFLIF